MSVLATSTSEEGFQDFVDHLFESPVEPQTKKKKISACDFCRGLHLRCDGLSPCFQCTKRNNVCVHSARSVRSRSPSTPQFFNFFSATPDPESSLKSQHPSPMGAPWNSSIHHWCSPESCLSPGPCDSPSRRSPRSQPAFNILLLEGPSNQTLGPRTGFPQPQILEELLNLAKEALGSASSEGKAHQLSLIFQCLIKVEPLLFTPEMSVVHACGLLWQFYQGSGNPSGCQLFGSTAFALTEKLQMLLGSELGRNICCLWFTDASTRNQAQVDNLFSLLEKIPPVSANEVVWRMYATFCRVMKQQIPQTQQSLIEVLKKIDDLNQTIFSMGFFGGGLLMRPQEACIFKILFIGLKSALFWKLGSKDLASLNADQVLLDFIQNEQLGASASGITLNSLFIALQVHIRIGNSLKVVEDLAILARLEKKFELAGKMKELVIRAQLSEREVKEDVGWSWDVLSEAVKESELKDALWLPLISE